MDNKEVCECATAIDKGPRELTIRLKLALIIASLAAWWLLYRQLEGLAQWVTYGVLGLARGTHLGVAVAFFLYDVPKIMMLLVLVVFGVGLVRSFFTPERTRTILAGKRETLGDVLAALLGIVTPFCSCSAVPLFIGFIESGIPIGVTFAFLISAPMVNEIALVLLWGLFGWRVAFIYMSTGLAIAMVTGWIIGRLDMERQVEDWAYQIRMASSPQTEQSLTWSARIDYAWQTVKDILGKVWPYIILGIAVGAGIHGYVPEGMMAAIMGKNAWWSVPLAVLIGAPIYSNAAGIIPVVQALLAKGASLGTVLAFMMSVIGISLPEIIILRKVLKPRLIAVFVGVVTVGIMMVGFLFNVIL
ncbi:MAG: permease [Desulfobaccales bacterium]|nr:permease [Desulfobaccales bacterium]